jgi:hypothetical protein
MSTPIIFKAKQSNTGHIGSVKRQLVYFIYLTMGELANNNSKKRYEMGSRPKKSLSACVALAACLSLSPLLLAGEEFQARILMGSGGHPAETVMNVKILVESYSSREEILQLMEIINQSGYEAFMTAFRGMEKGAFIPVGSRGVKIILHAARSIQTEKGRRILLFTERQSWDVHVSQRIDRRFPFMAIELNIDNTGRGDGKIYEEAHIVLTPQGTIEMDSSNSPPKQLFGVRLVK